MFLPIRVIAFQRLCTEHPFVAVLGTSRYITYFIEISESDEELKQIANEKQIIRNLDAYTILPNGNYKIAEGVEVFMMAKLLSQ